MKYIVGLKDHDIVEYLKVYEPNFMKEDFCFRFGSTCLKDAAYRFDTKGEAITAYNVWHPQNEENVYPFIMKICGDDE